MNWYRSLGFLKLGMKFEVNRFRKIEDPFLRKILILPKFWQTYPFLPNFCPKSNLYGRISILPEKIYFGAKFGHTYPFCPFWPKIKVFGTLQQRGSTKFSKIALKFVKEHSFIRQDIQICLIKFYNRPNLTKFTKKSLKSFCKEV